MRPRHIVIAIAAGGAAPCGVAAAEQAVALEDPLEDAVSVTDRALAEEPLLLCHRVPPS